jgi:hypothetical protein
MTTSPQPTDKLDATTSGRGEWTRGRLAPPTGIGSYGLKPADRRDLLEPDALKGASPVLRRAGHSNVPGLSHRGRTLASSESGTVRFGPRTEGATTTALATRTRADTKPGLGTVDDIRLGSRQIRARVLAALAASERAMENSRRTRSCYRIHEIGTVSELRSPGREAAALRRFRLFRVIEGYCDTA